MWPIANATGKMSQSFPYNKNSFKNDRHLSDNIDLNQKLIWMSVYRIEGAIFWCSLSYSPFTWNQLWNHLNNYYDYVLCVWLMYSSDLA